MKNFTSVLSDEHKHILKLIEALNFACDRLEEGGEINQAFFNQAIDFIRNYADKFHHAKEEDILFKAICGRAKELHCNPVDQMLYEHKLGRGYLAALSDGVKASDREKIMKNARAYARLLQEHIFKEDQVLYPLAARALSPDEQKNIVEQFKQAENKVFSQADKEKYLAFIDGLEK